MSAATVLVSGRRARDSLAVAAALAVEAECARAQPTLLVELRPEPRRRPATLMCSSAARELEAQLRAVGLAAAARGRMCHLSMAEEAERLGELAGALDGCGAEIAVVHASGHLWVPALDLCGPSGGVLVADRASERSLAALAVAELHDRGLRARVETRPPGPLAGRRALAGIRPGGEASGRAARMAAALFGPPGRAHAE
jgi:hypothetical protein